MPRPRPLALAIALALPLTAAVVALPRPAASAPRIYEARGVIKSFGPERRYANIAHEAIAGYMDAMTMSFDAKEAGQLDPFKENDKVAFSFTDEDGKRTIVAIKLDSK